MSNWQKIIQELQHYNLEINPTILEMIRHAQRVFVAGAGRSGLAIKALAMRLSQMNVKTEVVGSVTTTAFTAKDVLIIASGSGNTASMVNIATRAHAIGGQIILLTTTEDSKLATLANQIVKLPGKNKFSNQTTVQPMGALFEQAVWLYGDTFVVTYMDKYQLNEASLQKRHANLE